MKKSIIVILITIVCLLVATNANAHSLQYQLIDLGKNNYPYSINNKGQIAGMDNDNLIMYENGNIIELGFLPGGHPRDINELGKIVGDAGLLGPISHAFIYSNGVITDLGTFGGESAIAQKINDSGELVVSAYYGDNIHKSYIYDSNGIITNLDMLVGSTLAFSINNHKQVVGFNTCGGTFLYENGTMRIISTSPIFIPSRYNAGYDINDSGSVLGLRDNGSTYAPFIWENENVTDMGTLYGIDTRAYAINNLGQAVGTAWMPSQNTGWTHAFLWQNGSLRDLNELIPANSGWILLEATDINDKGQIIGWADTGEGGGHGFLLNPNPVIDVNIDLKPLGEPNIINWRQNHGKIAVAVLSTPDFNAPDMVDMNSLTFGRTGDEASFASCDDRTVDVNRDRRKDLICHFYKEYTDFQCGDTEGILKGQTKEGVPIEGRDSVWVVPCR
jgi:probable HAF family extracellular repeat protein